MTDTTTDTSELPMPRAPHMLTPEEYDELTDAELEAAIGREVDTYAGYVGSVARCNDGGVRVRVVMTCATCGTAADHAHYLSGGPHRGALCYVYDTDGNFLADLRNQNYVCDRCPT